MFIKELAGFSTFLLDIPCTEVPFRENHIFRLFQANSGFFVSAHSHVSNTGHIGQYVMLLEPFISVRITQRPSTAMAVDAL